MTDEEALDILTDTYRCGWADDYKQGMIIRNISMFKDRKEGLTFTAIANKHDITRTRARQVIKHVDRQVEYLKNESRS